MSNSATSNQPRRNQGAAPRRQLPNQADLDLQYDGDEVPVLIRLPDLSFATTPAVATNAATSEPDMPGPESDESVQVSSKKNRRRKRDARKSRTPKKAPQAPRQENAVLIAASRVSAMIDKSRMLVAAALVLVTALTYFALQGGGGGEVSPESDTTWEATAEHVPSENQEISVPAPIPEQADEQYVDLWPSDASSTSPQPDSPATRQQPTEAWPQRSGDGIAAGGTVENRTVEFNAPARNGPEQVVSQPAPLSGANLADRGTGEPLTVGQNNVARPSQAASSGEPVVGWPDASPDASAAGGTGPGSYVPPGANYYNGPTARTGRRETGYVPGQTSGDSARLNGTIEIPRPESDHERDGSHLY